jgi:hypothetical protein
MTDCCSECERLRQALRDICQPIEFVLQGYTEEQRRNVNGMLLVRLTESPGFLQDIARKALEATDD